MSIQVDNEPPPFSHHSHAPFSLTPLPRPLLTHIPSHPTTPTLTTRIVLAFSDLVHIRHRHDVRCARHERVNDIADGPRGQSHGHVAPRDFQLNNCVGQDCLQHGTEKLRIAFWLLRKYISETNIKLTDFFCGNCFGGVVSSPDPPPSRQRKWVWPAHFAQNLRLADSAGEE